MELTGLKDEVKRLKGKVRRLEDDVRSYDQGMQTLMVERADLINQVMHWEAEAYLPRISSRRLNLPGMWTLPMWSMQPYPSLKLQTSLQLCLRRIAMSASTPR